MTEIPQAFYYLIGTLIIANFSAIIAVVAAAGRALWWVSKLDSRVEDAKATAVRAHKRIDLITKEGE